MHLCSPGLTLPNQQIGNPHKKRDNLLQEAQTDER